MRAAKIAKLVGQLFNGGDLAWVGGDDHGGGRLGEEAEERMRHERLFLLDGCADAQWECGLRQGDGDAAVGDVARGVDQLALGQTRSAGCADRLRRRDRAEGAGPRCRRGPPLRTPKSRRRPVRRLPRHRSPPRSSGSDAYRIAEHGSQRGRRWLPPVRAGNGTLRLGSGSSPAGMGQSSRMASPAR